MLQGTDKNEESDSAELTFFFFVLLLLAFLQDVERQGKSSAAIIYVGGMGTLVMHRRRKWCYWRDYFPFLQYHFFNVNSSLSFLL